MQSSRCAVRECDVLWNFREQTRVLYRGIRLGSTPVIYGIATEHGVASGLSATSLWLSLWGSIEPGKEPEFVDQFLRLGQEEKKKRLAVGGDEFHLVPGIPLIGDSGIRLKDALLKRGFSGADAFDFVGDLFSGAIQNYIEQANGAALAEKWDLRSVDSRNDTAALERFLQKEFPGRWAREFAVLNEYRDMGRSFWATLHKGSSEAVGFARMAVRGRLEPLDHGWSPGALRLPLRMVERDSRLWTEHDACLGPIGVAVSQRGLGAGKILLGYVLAQLQREVNKLTTPGDNAGRVCIDWTNAIKYYEPLKLEQSRHFWTTWRSARD